MTSRKANDYARNKEVELFENKSFISSHRYNFTIYLTFNSLIQIFSIQNYQYPFFRIYKWKVEIVYKGVSVV